MDNVIVTLKTVNAKYKTRWFTIIAVTADNRFSALKKYPDFLELGITLNLTAKDEHKLCVERFNRTIKEKFQMCMAGTKFTKLSKEWW